MSATTNIEWADATWNPVTGCTKVSQGCKHCYAETWANRHMGEFAKDPTRKFTDVRLHPEKLDIPRRWKKPRKIFVNSMSDLFHEDVPTDFIQSVFDAMSAAPWHVFIILTKRPERMSKIVPHIRGPLGLKFEDRPWENVWLGVSVEDQKTADERYRFLYHTPASVRFLSIEPMLGPIDLSETFGLYEIEELEWGLKVGSCWAKSPDWIIVGGESGPNARPMHPEWVRSIRNQCQAAKVPFFFKQWGEWVPMHRVPRKPNYWGMMLESRRSPVSPEIHIWDEKEGSCRVGKKAAGSLLDGREWKELPR